MQLLKMAMRRWKRDERRRKRTKECKLGSCTSPGGGVALMTHNAMPSSVMSTGGESSVRGGSMDNGLGGPSAHSHTNNMVLRKDIALPVQLWDGLFIVKSFTQEIWDGNISTAVTTTRGAPFICSFQTL